MMLPNSSSWFHILRVEYAQSYFKSMEKHINTAIEGGAIIYPSPSQYFRAMEFTPFHHIRVVIVGGEPYHEPGRATGLLFSIPMAQSSILTTELKTIFKAIKADTKLINTCGDLSHWALQNVLLLPTVFTVERGKPNSHTGIGWEILTRRIIEHIDAKAEPTAWILWGEAANKMRRYIQNPAALILSSCYPDARAGEKGFYFSRQFSRVNTFLMKHRYKPIDWSTL